MQAGIVKWWPVPLIALYVVLIRFGGAPATVASWMWAPIAAGFVVVLVLKRDRLRPSPGLWLFGAYVVYTALSLGWSPDFGRGLRFVALIGAGFLAFVYGRAAGAPGGDSNVSWAATFGLCLALAGLLLVTDPPDFDELNPDRILGMGALALVVMAWYGRRGRAYTLGLGMLGLAAIFLSSSRTTLLMVVGLLITAPGLRLTRSARWLIPGALVALGFVVSLTPAFQERWFESGSGSLWDLVTAQGLETSGRGEVWPVVAASCGSPILGDGAGAADSYARAEHSGFPEPHNEYLRVWCDTGIVGSLLLWGFVVMTVVRAASGVRHTFEPWPDRAAIQLAVALLLLSLTDNPLTTGVPFMIPACLAFGWSEYRRRRDQPVC